MRNKFAFSQLSSKPYFTTATNKKAPKLSKRWTFFTIVHMKVPSIWIKLPIPLNVKLLKVWSTTSVKCHHNYCVSHIRAVWHKRRPHSNWCAPNWNDRILRNFSIRLCNIIVSYQRQKIQLSSWAHLAVHRAHFYNSVQMYLSAYRNPVYLVLIHGCPMIRIGDFCWKSMQQLPIWSK